MKKHYAALEARRSYLTGKLEGGPKTNTDIFFLDLWVAEKEALDWALGKLVADPEREILPIGTTGHYGPIRRGEKVQAKIDVTYADIVKGEVGQLTDFDRWAGEEYPYIATFDGGRTAAFAREDIRRID